METENRSKNRNQEDGRRFVFDHFEIEAANRMLLHGGKEVPLTARVFDILLVLAENPGRLLGKDELIKKVWHEEFVEEGNLARNVSTLRKALGDTGKEHKYIVTVQGRGYRFIGDVTSLNGHEQPSRNTSIAEHQSSHARSWRKWYWALGVLVASGAVVFAMFYNRTSRSVVSSASTIEQIRLTTGGKANKAAMSADGQLVVYVENGELKTKSVSGGNDRVLSDASRGLTYVSLALSPDGAGVYYSARLKGSSMITLYKLPLSGGEPQKILDDVYGTISFSPDGRKFVFVRRYPELNQNILIIADADGANTRRLAVTQRPNHFDGSPSWSPDGATIVCPAISTDGGFHFVILAVSVANGAAETIQTRRWSWLSSLVWLPDSRSLLIIGQDEAAITAQVWRLDRFTGDTRRMSDDDSFIYESLSGSRNGNKFVAIKKRVESHVWIVDRDAVQVTTGFDRYDGLSGLAWDRDGRLLFHSRASGRDAIWRMNADGSGSAQLTPDGGSGFTLSRDGRFLVFQSMESNNLGLSRLDLTNGDKKRLTENSTDMTPSFTPDGKSIVYSHFAEKHSVNKISADGGESSKLFDEYRTVSSPTVSPDMKQIAFAFRRTQADELEPGIAVLSLDNGLILKTFAANIRLGTIYERPTLQWSADGQWLYYIDYSDGVSNVWKINTADGSSLAVTNFKVGRVYNFALSPDGARLALARGTVESDVLLIHRSD